MNPSPSISKTTPRNVLLLLGIILLVLLSFLFSPGFKSEQAHFANDGPFGAQVSQIYRMPSAFFGIWSDLYWLGAYSGHYSPNFTGVLLWFLGPIGFNKFIVPISQLILGLSAAYFFRQLRLKPVVCILGGLAAAAAFGIARAIT